jgi:putative membrane protein
MKFIANVIVTAFALLLLDRFLDGIRVDDVATAFIGAMVLTLLHSIVKPILIFFTLPVTLLTLGLFVFIINGFVFYLAASFTPGFTIDTFGLAILGALALTVIQTLFSRFSS